MNTFESFVRQLYTVNATSFDNIALSVFAHQATHNPVYRAFIQHLRIKPEEVRHIHQIPFLPISFFKQHILKTGAWNEETFFSSSGTTGIATSKHFVHDLHFYQNHAQKCFEHFLGPLTDYHFLALLPSYLERENSSLVAMMQYFIEKSNSAYSGFYLHDTEKLLKDLKALKNDGKKVILWGVSFALLDLAEKHSPDLSHCIVFETGGMKGRRREMIREELHNDLKKGLNVNAIYSEYGMTELLSQAYMVGEGYFKSSPWMKIIGREIGDPFQKGVFGETCGINVIDLANWHTISFIETEDIGKVYQDGNFDILGRLDNSDVRGCNLMVE